MKNSHIVGFNNWYKKNKLNEQDERFTDVYNAAKKGEHLSISDILNSNLVSRPDVESLIDSASRLIDSNNYYDGSLFEDFISVLRDFVEIEGVDRISRAMLASIIINDSDIDNTKLSKIITKKFGLGLISSKLGHRSILRLLGQSEKNISEMKNSQSAGFDNWYKKNKLNEQMSSLQSHEDVYEVLIGKYDESEVTDYEETEIGLNISHGISMGVADFDIQTDGLPATVSVSCSARHTAGEDPEFTMTARLDNVDDIQTSDQLLSIIDRMASLDLSEVTDNSNVNGIQVSFLRKHD